MTLRKHDQDTVDPSVLKRGFFVFEATAVHHELDSLSNASEDFVVE